MPRSYPIVRFSPADRSRIVARMRRTPMWLVFVGGAVTVVGVLIQAFTIAAYFRGAGEGALDAHGGFSMLVHVGQLLIVIGAIWAWWGNWGAVGLAVAFLVVCFAQLAFLGDTEEPGGWINGLHGALALVILLVGAWCFSRGRRELGLGGASTAA
jgi:hypothetical protein